MSPWTNGRWSEVERTQLAAWRCLERLEKPISELEHLAERLGPDEEVAWRLRAIERMVERAAAELRDVVE